MLRLIAPLTLAVLCLGCQDKPGPGAPTTGTPGSAKAKAKAGATPDTGLLKRLDALGDRGLLVGVLDGREWGKVHQRLTPALSKLPAPMPAEFTRVADTRGLLNVLYAGLFGAKDALDLSALDPKGSIIVSLFEPATVGPPGASAAHLRFDGEPSPLRHEVVLPATDASALAAAVLAGLKKACKPVAHGCDFGELQVGVKAEGDTVRIGALFPAQAKDAKDRLWPTPLGASVRTPAYTQLATPGAGIGLLIRPWRLRAMAAQQGVNAMTMALASAPADARQSLFAYGLTMVFNGVQLMHAERPDLEDALVRLVADDAGVAFEGTHVLTAATAKAFKDAIAQRGRTLAVKVPVIAQVAQRLDLNALLDGVGPRPIFAKMKRLRDFSRGFAECGSGCLLHTFFRVPISTARGALDLAPAEVKAIVRALPTAMQGVLVRLDNFKPVVALAGDVTQDFDTGQLRALPGSEVHLIPKDDRAMLLVGIGVDPRTVFDVQATTAHTTTSAARVEPSALATLGTLLGAGPITPFFDALGPITADSALAPGGHAFAWRIHLSTSPGVTPSAFAPAATAAFDGPIQGFTAGEGDGCLRDAIAGTSKGFAALANVPPETRAALLVGVFSEIAEHLKCAQAHAATEPASQGIRRLYAYLVGMIAQPERPDALAFLESQCAETKDAWICAEAARVKALPPPAAPPSGARAPATGAGLAMPASPQLARLTGDPALGVKLNNVELAAQLAEISTGEVDTALPVEPVDIRTQAMLQAVIRVKTPQARHCYERSLVKDPKLAGTATVSFVVEPDGATKDIVSTGDALPAELHACLVRRVRGWRFVPAKVQSKVSYPFVFKSN